jgi:hypothetical protein
VNAVSNEDVDRECCGDSPGNWAAGDCRYETDRPVGLLFYSSARTIATDRTGAVHRADEC